MISKEKNYTNVLCYLQENSNWMRGYSWYELCAIRALNQVPLLDSITDFHQSKQIKRIKQRKFRRLDVAYDIEMITEQFFF